MIPPVQAEKARSDALVQRMSGLLACFPFKGADVGGVPNGAASISTPTTAVPAMDEMDEVVGEWWW